MIKYWNIYTCHVLLNFFDRLIIILSNNILYFYWSFLTPKCLFLITRIGFCLIVFMIRVNRSTRLTFLNLSHFLVYLREHCLLYITLYFYLMTYRIFTISFNSKILLLLWIIRYYGWIFSRCVIRSVYFFQFIHKLLCYISLLYLLMFHMSNWWIHQWECLSEINFWRLLLRLFH